jgi:RNA polymerase sigma factor (sigma-70 family)
MTTNRSVPRLSGPQYGKGNFAVNSRTPWRTWAAMSSRQTGFFLCDFHPGGCYKVNMTPDSELLRRYAGTKSEEAFAELVQRHVNLVYSAALRQVNGDAHLAQDVAQIVFTDLARKAAPLSRRATLTGWLYTSAHFAAAKTVRTENRRHDREEKFMREPISETAPELDWEKLHPVLDDAMHELKEADREAILFRYFENRPFAEIGGKLGLNENAARMRVERALEKLRAAFLRRGVATTTALASVISANAIQLAPANLAATVTTASLAAAGTGTFTFLKIMTATKLKFAIGTVVVAAVATAFVLLNQVQKNLRAENGLLRHQIAQLQTDNESLSNRLAVAANSKSLSDEQFNELLKLRGEVTRLRQQQKGLPAVAQLKTNNSSSAQIIQIHLKARFISFPTDGLQALGVSWAAGAQGGKTGLLTEQQFKIINQALHGASDVETLAEPEVVTSNGRQTQMRVTQSVSVGGEPVEVGPTIDVVPNFLTNSLTFNLTLIATLVQLTGDPSKPGAQTIQAVNQVNLSPGQTVVLENEIPSGGWLPDSTNMPAGHRSLLVFVTPTAVDEAGNRIIFPPPNQ